MLKLRISITSDDDKHRLPIPQLHKCIYYIFISFSDPMKNPYICGRPECSLEGNKFDYAHNMRYKYNYRVHVRSEFSGSGENSSDVFISAKILLTFPSKCQGVLIVQNVELRHMAPPEEDLEVENDYSYDYSVKEDPSLHPKTAKFSEDIQEHEMK